MARNTLTAPEHAVEAGPVLARWLRQTAAALRVLAALLLLALVVNLFHHGAQPYAVNAIVPPWDKLAHLLLHASIATLLWVVAGGRHEFVVLALASAIAGADEYAQSQLPGRHADLLDLAASVSGALLALLVLRTIARRR